MKNSWRIRDIDEFAHVINEIEDKTISLLQSGDVVIEILDRKRTDKQNRSLHKYCNDQAKKLTDAGYTQRKLWEELKPGFELPVTMEMVKDIFRSMGWIMFKKKSTKDLTTVEMQEVYRSVDQGFGETTSVTTEWPSWRK